MDTQVMTTDLDPKEVDLSKVLTLGSYLDKIEESIAALRNSETFNIMMGDILKAYGEDKLYRLVTFSAIESITPLYDAEVVSQLSNANIASYCTIYKDKAMTEMYRAVVRRADGLQLCQDTRPGTGNHGIIYEQATNSFLPNQGWALTAGGVLLGVETVYDAFEKALITSPEHSDPHARMDS